MADLVSVAVGGGIAAAAMWLQHRLKVREEWRSKKVEKYVELRAAIDAYKEWVTAYDKGCDETGWPPKEVGPSPFSKIEDLCILYFPELIAATQKFNNHRRLHEIRTGADARALASRTDEDVDKWFEGYQRYNSAEFAFTSASGERRLVRLPHLIDSYAIVMDR